MSKDTGDLAMDVEKYNRYQAARALIAEYGLVVISQDEYDALRERAKRAEAAIRAMWPIFALSLAYGEHGRSSEQIELRKMADAFRVNPPTGVMDTIFEAVDTPANDAGKDGEG